MKLLMKASVLLPAALVLTGCASPYPVGTLYTDMTLPMQATASAGGSKVGTAECKTLLSMLATGDCSIEAAKANGGISTVSHVDWHANSILGLIGTYTVTVRGQ